jgi:DNA-binding CsgD family transcriptional regulator
VNVIDDAQRLVDDAHRAASDRLQARLRELEEQMAPLQAEHRDVTRALAQLTGRRIPTTRANASPPRVSKQQRLEQVLELVRSHDDLSTAELGRRLGISPNRATSLVKELRDAGHLQPGQPLRAGDPPAPGEPD